MTAIMTRPDRQQSLTPVLHPPRGWLARVQSDIFVAKGTIALLALAHLGVALGVHPPYPFANLLPGMPWLSEAVFITAAISIAAVLLRPCRLTAMVSMLTMITAAVTRIVVFLQPQAMVPTHDHLIVPAPPFFAWVMIIAFELWLWPALVGIAPKRIWRSPSRR